MTYQRVMPRPILLACLVAFSALAVFALLPGLARGATRQSSVLSWRPGWLPGDPETIPGAGLFIAIDPVTRLPIAPTPDQLRAWNTQRALDALRAPARPFLARTLANGGQIVHLNGAFRSYSIARVGKDGKVVTECVKVAPK